MEQAEQRDHQTNEPLSRLNAASLRISEGLEFETVLRHALESDRNLSRRPEGAGGSG